MTQQPQLHTFQTPEPTETDYRKYKDTMKALAQSLPKHLTRPVSETELIAKYIIALHFQIHGIKRFTEALEEADRKYRDISRDKDTYWKTLELALSTPEVKEATLQIIPNLDRGKYFPHNNPTPATYQITPRPTPSPKLHDTIKETISEIPRKKTATVTEYILKHAPSKSYELVYSTVLLHTKNKFSSKGKKVYPYGQDYAAEITDLKPRTLRRAWAWLRKRGILNKARNENPKEHHCSLWYVCTSIKQIGYFRDSKNRHPKTKPHN